MWGGGNILEIIAKDKHILIKKMEANEVDFHMYLKWMTDPETMKYWEGMTEHFTYSRVIENYWENIREQVEQCIIEYDQEPIGFCQYCLLNAEYYEVPVQQYEKFVSQTDTVYGIDIFIGEVPFRNRGIGTESMTLLIKALFEHFHADVILIDPKVHNARAIRCYHKSGFEEYFVVPHRELQDGIYHDSLIMGIRNPKNNA